MGGILSVLLVAAVVFGICFLADKIFTKAFRNQTQHQSGLAFDPQGHRIGYGGGFYDRFLAAEPDHPTLALCYDFQMLPALQTEEFDIPVDTVLWA